MSQEFLQSSCTIKRKANHSTECQHSFLSGPVTLDSFSAFHYHYTDNGMQKNKVILREQRHVLEEQGIHEIKALRRTPVGRWPAATVQKGNIYLEGHYSGLHSYQAVKRLY